MPVHDQAVALDVSEAPRFSNSSEASTQRMLSANCSCGSRQPEGRFSMKSVSGPQLIRVSKTLQDRIVPGRLEKFQSGPEDWIQPRRSVLHVKIERIEIAAEVKFWMIIQRAAPITLQTLRERPADDVAEGVEIQMEVQRDAVVEAEVIVIDGSVVHQGDAKGNRLSVLSPEKKAGAVRHAST